MASPKDFFLPEVAGDYPVFRGPLSTATKIGRMIDGEEIFKAEEEAIIGAEDSILFTTWAFDPALPVVSSKARALAASWGELLLLMARKNVEVRILMTDEDPIFRAAQHGQAWARFRALVNAANAKGIDTAAFQVVVAMHPAVWSLDLFGQFAGDRRLTATIDQLAAIKNKAALLTTLGDLPGLWDKLTLSGGTVASSLSGFPPSSNPGTHHQKLLLIDEQVAFIGGINHIPQNLDNRAHSAKLTTPYQWHDGAIRVEGKVVADIVTSGYRLWNTARLAADQFIAAANKIVPSGVAALPVRPTTDASQIGPSKSPKDGTIGAQAWRTVSTAIVKDVPTTSSSDIVTGYLQAIGLAESFIYIENQYLRDDGLANALIARQKAKADLNVIIVLPDLAEEMATASPDPISLVGIAEQHAIIDKLQAAFGTNLGVFTPLVPSSGKTRHMIYVHNKVMIVDDAFATLGSANANPRGFQLDTEMNLAWFDKGSVAGLRRDLWREMLGKDSGADSWKPKQFAARWSKIAAANAKRAPAAWQGFIVPYDNTPAGSAVPDIPVWLTEADPVGNNTSLA